MIRLLRGVVVVLMLIPAVGTAQADIINIADLLATNGAEQGKAYAQKNLGYMYRYGEGMHNGESVPQDYVEAVRWYRLAAEQGYAPAQLDLGEMYYNGEGVPQDYFEAVRWYRLAAKGGYVPAQFNLGEMYYNGEGVPQDWLCCTNRLKWDSCRESSVVAGAHEQTRTPCLQDQELARIQRCAEAPGLADDLV